MQWQNWRISTERLEELLRRTEAQRPLLRRALEEDIVAAVHLPQQRLAELEQQFREQHNLQSDEALQTTGLTGRRFFKLEKIRDLRERERKCCFFYSFFK